MNPNTNLTGLNRTGLPLTTPATDTTDSKGAKDVAEAKARAKAAEQAAATQSAGATPAPAANYDGKVVPNKFTSSAPAPGYTPAMGGNQDAYNAVAAAMKAANQPMPSTSDLTQAAALVANNPQAQALQAKLTAGITDPSKAPSTNEVFSDLNNFIASTGGNPMALMVIVMLGSIKDSMDQSNYEVNVLQWYNTAQKDMISYVDMLGQKRTELDAAIGSKPDATKTVQLDYKMTDVDFDAPIEGTDGQNHLQYNNPGAPGKTYTASDIPTPTLVKGSYLQGQKMKYTVTDPRDDKTTKTFTAKSPEDAQQQMADSVNQDQKSKASGALLVNTASLGEEMQRAQQRLDQLGNLQQQRSNKFQSAQQAQQQGLQMLTSIIKSTSDTLSAERRNLS